MFFPKLLRTTILGLITLFGGLILVGLAAWLHYWIDGSLNPDKVMPLEDWSLTLAVGSFFIQLSSSVEALLISLGTRFQWIKFNRGRLTVGLFSLIPLSYAIATVRGAIADPYINVWWVLLYELVLILPLMLAWRLLRFQRA